MIRLLTAVLISGLLVVACSSPKKSDRDSAPRKTIKASKVKDAKPRPEDRARYGNHSPYTVRGKQYYVLPTAVGYDEVGVASWYGTKFQGRPTSSGEPFDMYAATAAHKSLPLPTYAEVTNLANGRKVVVKINDRGPFAAGRIIDLSYGAAVRLDMVNTGTANVRVRAITFDHKGRESEGVDGDKGDIILQAGAFRQKGSAKELEEQLSKAGIRKTSVDRGRSSAGRVYRVFIGPLKSEQAAYEVITKMVELGFERPHRVSR